jgi:hypothetical protein
MRLETKNGILSFEEIDGIKIRSSKLHEIFIVLVSLFFTVYAVYTEIKDPRISSFILFAIMYVVYKIIGFFIFKMYYVSVLKDSAWHNLKKSYYFSARSNREKISEELLR